MWDSGKVGSERQPSCHVTRLCQESLTRGYNIDEPHHRSAAFEVATGNEWAHTRQIRHHKLEIAVIHDDNSRPG